MAPTPPRRPRRLAGLGVAVAMLAVGEIALRLGGVAPAQPVGRWINAEAARAHAGLDTVPDAELFWRLPSSRRILGGAYRTNALGLRGPEVERPKPPGTTRLALIGDSCAFGLGLDLPDTVGALLETLEGRAGSRVEVVPIAVPGYSSLQSLGLARRLFEDLQVDASVLWVGAFNDAAPACGASDARIAAAARSPTLGLLRRLALFRGIARLVRGSPAPCPPRGPAGPPRVSLAEMRANLAALEQLVRRGGRRSVVLVPPVVPGARAAPYARAIRRRPGAIDPALGREGLQADQIHPSRTGSVPRAASLAPALGLRGAIDPQRAADARRADLSEQAVARGDAAPALPALEELAGRYPDRPRLLAARVAAHEGLGHFPEARALVDRALHAHPHVTELHRLRAEVLAATGDEAGATRELRTTLARDPGWIAGHVALTRILRSQGDERAARAQLDAALRIAPESPELLRLSR